MHRITYSLTLKDILSRPFFIVKCLLVVLPLNLFLLFWFYSSMHAILDYLFRTLPDEIAGPLLLGISVGVGGVNGGMISMLIAILLVIWFTSRSVAHKLKDFTVSISEQSFSVVVPDAQAEVKWKNVLFVKSGKDSVWILADRPPVMSAVVTVPKRAFSSIEEADAFGQAAETYWKEQNTFPPYVRRLVDLLPGIFWMK